MVGVAPAQAAGNSKTTAPISNLVPNNTRISIPLFDRRIEGRDSSPGFSPSSPFAVPHHFKRGTTSRCSSSSCSTSGGTIHSITVVIPASKNPLMKAAHSVGFQNAHQLSTS